MVRRGRTLQHLNELSCDGWELAALDSVSFLGIDVGFYLVVKRTKGTTV